MDPRILTRHPKVSVLVWGDFSLNHSGLVEVPLLPYVPFRELPFFETQTETDVSL